jgi:hypothetical protein
MDEIQEAANKWDSFFGTVDPEREALKEELYSHRKYVEEKIKMLEIQQEAYARSQIEKAAIKEGTLWNKVKKTFLGL